MQFGGPAERGALSRHIAKKGAALAESLGADARIRLDLDRDDHQEVAGGVVG